MVALAENPQGGVTSLDAEVLDAESAYRQAIATSDTDVTPMAMIALGELLSGQEGRAADAETPVSRSHRYQRHRPRTGGHGQPRVLA
jgi:hypothetical protein